MFLCFHYWVALLFLVAAICFGQAFAFEGGSVLDDKRRLVVGVIALLAASVPTDFGEEEEGIVEEVVRRVGYTHRRRQRRFVRDMFNEYGPTYTRRAYRMKEGTFWKLERILRRHLVKERTARAALLRQSDGARNGRISSAIRVSAALRYFAGGRPDDICLSHGISHSEVFNSIWLVVDAVNSCNELAFQYPTSHDAQRAIAKGFQQISTPGFDNCAGCIDGMLVWTEKPPDKVAEYAGCPPKKFFCGRKHKFGLNFQGLCDHKGRFLDVSCGSPASTSDFLAFTLSSIFLRLEKNLLAPGLCIYGDAAYVNNRYMATPFKAISGGSRFHYNHYHSQVRNIVRHTSVSTGQFSQLMLLVFAFFIEGEDQN